jgi:hypothetical protein
MLAPSGPGQWEAWIASVDQIEHLHPKTVIAGHKAPDASDDAWRAFSTVLAPYIRDFRDAVAASHSADEVVEIIKTAHPDCGNLTTLLVSPRAAFPQRRLTAGRVGLRTGSSPPLRPVRRSP